jgi:hypothetical protein
MIRRLLILLALVALYAIAWRAYATNAWITESLPKHLGKVLPLFVKAVPADLTDPAVKRRLALAVIVTLMSLAAVLWAATRARRAIVCLLIAVPAVFTTNAAIAHVRAGRQSFVEPYSRPTLEYFHDVPLVADAPLRFVRDYPALRPRLSHHAATHPPGGVLFLWVGSKVFGSSIDAAAWWSVAFGALGVIPSFWLAHLIGGAAAARRLLPLYLLTPSLVLFGATSMDAVFLVFVVASLASGIAALGRPTPLRIAIAGAALWLAAFMTFAAIAVPMLLVAYAIFTTLRRPRVGCRMFLWVASIGIVFIACQLIAQLAIGYDFVATARGAIDQDYQGMKMTGYESFTLWWQISLGNLLAFLFGSGLVAMALFTMSTWAATGRQRSLARAVALGLLVLAASTLFTLETERVWMFVAPVILVAGTSQLKGWPTWAAALAGQLVQTFTTELLVNTRW